MDKLISNATKLRKATCDDFSN